ncbi:DC-STAMP domain-containing protein 2 isoform X2 [Onychostoma macrolepis]|uniref:DC-STAMP domain-containing protein 2 isoform X2 n=1 Tax=Onychostoma macrolepis TaxID=369639 RepID=UPI002729C7D2|nr:DC-STAMP domain-containing protein 2 isoform X2 [Onychostoma macrolepis]
MTPKEPFLKRLGRRLSRLRRGSAVRQLKRSLAGFTLGLFLASVYGMTALYIQNHNLWFCIITTGLLAACAGFGSGLSDRVRTNVMLMFPMLCSIRGKNFLLFLICTLVIQGPVSNTMENVERAADSVICGAELAMNQTRQLLQRATNPLLPALSKIKQIARNAHSMAGRAQNFIRTLTESVRHVARTLRNVLHFLANIGDVCNDNLGLPYQKCTRLFDEARENCMELLSVFSFLCHLLDGFQPLCGLARGASLWDSCSASYHHILLTTLRLLWLFQPLQPLIELKRSLNSTFLPLPTLTCFWTTVSPYRMLLRRSWRRCQRSWASSRSSSFCWHTWVSSCFYSCISSSLYLTVRERRAIAGRMLSLFRCMVMTVIPIAVDFMVFWVFELVHHQAQGEIVTKAPVVVAVNVNGSGYASDIFRDIAASFDILQKGNITVLSKKCLMKPLEPDYMRYLLIGLLYGFTLFIVVAGGYVKRLQRLVCARYHPEREKKRIQYLHRHILTQRGSLGKALLRAVQRNRIDQQHDGIIQTLAKHLPGGAIIARLLDIGKESCVACGKVLKTRGHDDEVHICPTPRCTGHYCSLCFRLMGKLCAICMAPLTFHEDQELDSSDEEQAGFWETAVRSPQPGQSTERKGVTISISDQDHSIGMHGPTYHQNVEYTDLELAINTLVKNFHSASPTDADTLTAQEFQSMISKELPTMVKTAGDQEGLNKLLTELNVEEGKGITFKDFWRLVDSLATAQFGLQSKEKQVKCVKCSLM